MIPDAPPFLYSVFPYICIFGGTLIGLLIGILLYEKATKKTILPYTISLRQSWLWVLFALNLIFYAITIPCAEIGANCWENCFGFGLIGMAGHISNVMMVLMTIVLFLIVLKVRQTFVIGGFLFLYGIFGFLQALFLDKGLWCICRSSGYYYLFPSFSLVILMQWVVYLITLFCIASVVVGSDDV